jgi:hypothetical protein
MPITLPEFDAIERKVITLMGMSGVGKTHTSCMLARHGWFHYSCDLEIGTRYLGDELVKTLNRPNSVTAEDLSMLSEYVGRLGVLPLGEFKRRQKQYYDAECQSLARLQGVVRQAHVDGFTQVVNDSTGSMCEIDNETLIASVDENSLIVYIKANEDEEKLVLKRAQTYPKPMFFSPERFDFWVDQFLSERGIASTHDMNADEFSRWVFPRLFENRLPKYQRIADTYGVTIPSEAFRSVGSADEFLNVIRAHLQ